ncbi:oligosaccharide flippase family protein [Ruegeria marisrubri]|uniref:oligosaccharide flippase family protein n=1 Tax=Ruegeria marisrubri TaxID=1685379 RepID=UPI00082F5FE0|nr:oligosaccharide flippase family protein [Ruegeria marisrubri]
MAALKGHLLGQTGRQGASLAFAQAVTVVAGIGIGSLLARGLGVEGYGRYLFALTVVQVMMIPLDFGLPTLVMREVAVLRARGDWALLGGLLRWSIAFVAVIWALLAIGILGWIHLIETEDLLYIFAVLLAGVWAYMRFAAAILRGMEKVVWAALPDQVIRPLTMLAALTVVSLIGTLTPSRAMALHTLAATVGLFWAVWILHRRSGPALVGQTGGVRYAPRVWFASLLPLGMEVGAGFLNARIDVLMLGFLTDSRAVGIYGLGLLIGGLARMPETVIKQIAAPRVARYHAEGRTVEIRHLARLSAGASVCAAMISLFGILLIGKPVVALLAGPEFEPSVMVAAIVASSSIVTGFWCLAATILNMTGHEKHTARISWSSTIINALANLALIPLLGALGAALATAVVTGARQFAFETAARNHAGMTSGLLRLTRRTLA